MLTSLAFGPGSLTEIVKEEEISVQARDRNTQPRLKKVKVKVIDQKNPLGTFDIGHNTAVSETFLPQIHFDKSAGIVYTDIAGLHDTGGDLIELINSFVNKQIFIRAASIRIILPMTKAQIFESRGKGARELIKIIGTMCQSSLDEMSKSIQTVLTMCKYADDDLDMDLIRSTLWEQFQRELAAEKQINGIDDKPDEQSALSRDPSLEMDMMSKHYKEIEYFYEECANKIEMFDPLDRDLPTSDND